MAVLLGLFAGNLSGLVELWTRRSRRLRLLLGRLARPEEPERDQRVPALELPLRRPPRPRPRLSAPPRPPRRPPPHRPATDEPRALRPALRPLAAPRPRRALPRDAPHHERMERPDGRRTPRPPPLGLRRRRHAATRPPAPGAAARASPGRRRRSGRGHRPPRPPLHAPLLEELHSPAAKRRLGGRPVLRPALVRPRPRARARPRRPVPPLPPLAHRRSERPARDAGGLLVAAWRSSSRSPSSTSRRSCTAASPRRPRSASSSSASRLSASRSRSAPRSPRENGRPRPSPRSPSSSSAACELVWVWDRMNTVFKFGLDATLLLAVAGAAALERLLAPAARARPAARGASPRPSRASPLSRPRSSPWPATSGRAASRRPAGRSTGWPISPSHRPDEAAAVEWIEKNVPGLPSSPRRTARLPGVRAVLDEHRAPDVVGWDYHLVQRGKHRPAIEKRIVDSPPSTPSRHRTPAEVLSTVRYPLRRLGPRGADGTERRREAFRRLPGLLVAGLLPGTSPSTASASDLVSASRSSQVADRRASAAEPRRGRRTWRNRGASPAARTAGSGSPTSATTGSCDSSRASPIAGPFGAKGTGPLEFQQPSAIAIGAYGRVFVADTWNARIQVLAPEGDLPAELAGGLFGPRGIAVDVKGARLRLRHRQPPGREALARRKDRDGMGRGRDRTGPALEPDGNRRRLRRDRLGLRQRERPPLPVRPRRTPPVDRPGRGLAAGRLLRAPHRRRRRGERLDLGSPRGRGAGW